MTVLDDRELLVRARALDMQALGLIHDTYYPRLFRYVALRVRDRTTAEDLTSEVFARLLAALRDDRAPKSTLRGWLFGVAANVVVDHQRRSYRAEFVPLDRDLTARDGDPDREVEGILAREGLFAAMDDLTEDQRDVLSMRYGAGLPIREVAEAMGKSEGAIKQLQLRAVARLGRLMAQRTVGGGGTA